MCNRYRMTADERAMAERYSIVRSLNCHLAYQADGAPYRQTRIMNWLSGFELFKISLRQNNLLS